VTAEGGAAITRTLTIGPGERQVLALEIPASSAVASEITRAEPLSVAQGRSAPGAASQPAAAPPALLVARDQQPEPRGRGHRRTLSTFGFAAAGVGAALGGAALGVYLWNRGRYQDWQTNNAALQRDMGAIDYRARQIANNRLADSLTTANHLMVGLSVAGGALLATGMTLLVVDRVRRDKEASPPSTSMSGVSLGWGWQGSSSGSISWSRSW
jgi:hypothetical protein